MKTVCLIGMTGGFYSKAGAVIDAATVTLGELGLSITQIKLLDCFLPYYEQGAVSENFVKLAASVRDVKNIMLAYNATDGTPCAAMKVFLEYLGAAENRALIEDKYVLNMAFSNSEGEKEAAEHVSNIIERQGGFELIRVCVGGKTLNDILCGALQINQIEKYAEDYYRLIRQNRVFLRSSAYNPEAAASARSVSGDYMNLRSQVESSMQNTVQNTLQSPTHKEVARNAQNERPEMLPAAPQGNQKKPTLDLDMFNSRQKEDIEELTRLFSGKMKTGADLGKQPPPAAPEFDREQPYPRQPQGYTRSYSQKNQPHIAPNDFREQLHGAPQQQPYQPQPPYQMPPATYQPPPYQPPPYQPQQDAGDGILKSEAKPREAAVPPVVPRNKTCRQMTQSLPHYFQPQLAQGTEAVFQFLISGEEDFSGYLIIRNKDNDYYDGQHETPDITIISPSGVWQDVLKGKLTAQKAFMTGQLKVRGNFMLLNRFDQLYKKM